MIAGQISLKTMQVRQPKPPYWLSAQARLTIVCSVLLTWLSVVGMSLSIMGAGAVIDGGGSELILWGVILTFTTIMIRTMVVARGHIAEESRIRHRIIDAVFTSGPVDSTGAVVSLATESSEKMMALRVGFVGQVVASLTAPLVVLGVIGTMSGRIALILLGMLVIVPLLICGFRKIISTVSSGSQDARKALAAAYMDALKSLSTLQLLGAAGRISDQLAATGERNRQAVMRLLKGNQLILFVMDAAFYLFVVTTTVYLVLSSTTLTTGQAVAIMGLSILLLEPMDQVGAFFYVGMSGLGAQRGIFGFLRGRSKARRRDVPIDPHQEAAVSITDLSFGYDDRDVLSHINLAIAPGERVGIIGRSGQGKSTLLALMGGDLIPRSGQVTLREASASVAQTTWLFTGTIADNLRLADPDADDARLWRALEAANLDDEVRRMPEGLSTLLGEQGLGLSGGQAQRVSLARAFLADRPLLILDEPTSQVDLDSEAQIVEAIDRLAQGRTVLTVSHRAGALTTADRVVRVADGRVSVAEPDGSDGSGSSAGPDPAPAGSGPDPVTEKEI